MGGVSLHFSNCSPSLEVILVWEMTPRAGAHAVGPGSLLVEAALAGRAGGSGPPSCEIVGFVHRRALSPFLVKRGPWSGGRQAQWCGENSAPQASPHFSNSVSLGKVFRELSQEAGTPEGWSMSVGLDVVALLFLWPGASPSLIFFLSFVLFFLSLIFKVGCECGACL